MLKPIRLLVVNTERGVVLIEKWVIFTVFMALIVDLSLQVIFRFAIDEPLDFTEELARVLFAWLVYIGAAHAVYLSENFMVDILYNALPSSLQKVVGYFIDLAVIAFTGVMAYYSYLFSIKGAGQVLPVLDVSVAVQNYALPIGLTFMLIHCLSFLVRGKHVGDRDKVIEPEHKEEQEA